jgi:hypothetical protein
MEGIGLALDLKGGRMFITDFGGSVYSANLDGSNRRTLLIERVFEAQARRFLKSRTRGRRQHLPR